MDLAFSNAIMDLLYCKAYIEIMGPPSMAASESGGVRLRVTECLRHFANMNVVGARRKHSGRYIKSRAGTPPHRVADLFGNDFVVNRKNFR